MTHEATLIAWVILCSAMSGHGWQVNRDYTRWHRPDVTVDWTFIPEIAGSVHCGDNLRRISIVPLDAAVLAGRQCDDSVAAGNFL